MWLANQCKPHYYVGSPMTLLPDIVFICLARRTRYIFCRPMMLPLDIIFKLAIHIMTFALQYGCCPIISFFMPAYQCNAHHVLSYPMTLPPDIVIICHARLITFWAAR
jgi:hypothetical protein